MLVFAVPWMLIHAIGWLMAKGGSFKMLLALIKIMEMEYNPSFAMHFTTYQQFLAHLYKTAYLRYHTYLKTHLAPRGLHNRLPWWHTMVRFIWFLGRLEVEDLRVRRKYCYLKSFMDLSHVSVNACEWTHSFDTVINCMLKFCAAMQL